MAKQMEKKITFTELIGAAIYYLITFSIIHVIVNRNQSHFETVVRDAQANITTAVAHHVSSMLQNGFLIVCSPMPDTFGLSNGSLLCYLDKLKN